MTPKRWFILGASAVIVFGLCLVERYETAVYFVAAFLCGSAQARATRQ